MNLGSLGGMSPADLKEAVFWTTFIALSDIHSYLEIEYFDRFSQKLAYKTGAMASRPVSQNIDSLTHCQ